MSGLLREEDWEILVRRISTGKCTPFLGAGACYGVLPLGGDIAKGWALKYEFPLEDASNLIAVSQYLALQRDPAFPKEELVGMWRKFPSPDFEDKTEPHRVLAGLPLPIYITTNYDDFMVKALSYQHRDPVRVLCQWNRAVKDYVADTPTIFDREPAFRPTVAAPVVFHLHGYIPLAESLVLTEDDYMDFLVNVASDPNLIPPQIARALTGTSLLFLGYRIADWNFRVLLRSFARFMERSQARLNVAVMLAPSADESIQQKVQEYLTKYYENIDVRVYWGTVKEFLAELKQYQLKFSDE
jgi:hypothetical protein